MRELSMCEHKSKRIQKKIMVREEEVPCAYAATQTKVVFQVIYRCDDCGKTWTEQREEWQGSYS
jgi:hypothetical protein